MNNIQVTKNWFQKLVSLAIFREVSRYQFPPDKKSTVDSPSRLDYLAGQVTFKAYLPNLQGSRKVIL